MSNNKRTAEVKYKADAKCRAASAESQIGKLMVLEKYFYKKK